MSCVQSEIPTLAEQVSVERLTPGQHEYVSKRLPVPITYAKSMAYGGCILSVAVSAACDTVHSSLDMYSVLGHFHEAASSDESLRCTVEKVRATRSFATRRVRVDQYQSSGSSRTCLEVSIDFHARESSSLDYSVRPVLTWPKPENCPTSHDQVKSLRERKIASEAQDEKYKRTIQISDHFIETRCCPTGISGQDLFGTASTTPTTQDHLPIASKTSAEWQRSRTSLMTKTENVAALAFLMDGTCSFVPLMDDHKWFKDVNACYSIDVALRIFANDINLEDWHLVEKNAIRAKSNRAFAESRIWDGTGSLIAHMSQQSIIRLKFDSRESYGCRAFDYWVALA